MQINRDTKMADTILMNYALLPVLNRFDIHLGFGDRTVEEVCNRKNVNIDFFLEIVNSFNDKSYFPEVRLKAFSIRLITDYIKKSHDYYLNCKVPEIEHLIAKLLQKSEHKDEYKLIDRFYQGYKTELITHIRKEEEEVIPYILMLDEVYSKNTVTEEIRKLIKQNSISSYAEEHDNVEDKLDDLKNIIIKYLPPLKDYSVSNTLITELFRLERDLDDHARIENQVLIPKIQQLEEEIMNM